MIFFSSYEPLYLLLPVIGFIIGLLGTMLGGGGGFFFLPVLTLLMGVPPHVAVATSLAATIPIGFVGTLSHHKNGNVDVKTGVLFVVAGIVGAFAGAGISQVLSGKQLKIAFGIFSILIALNMVFESRRGNNKKQTKGSTQMGKKAKGAFFGISAGMIAGTFGTSGTAPVLAGLFSMKLPVKLVVGTSLLVVLANAIFATGAHFLVGEIDLTLIAFITSGSVIGALLGPKLLSRMNFEKKENRVQYLYAMVVAAIGILMITR